jgi:hypothetical protein
MDSPECVGTFSQGAPLFLQRVRVCIRTVIKNIYLDISVISWFSVNLAKSLEIQGITASIAEQRSNSPAPALIYAFPKEINITLSGLITQYGCPSLQCVRDRSPESDRQPQRQKADEK